MYSNGDRKWRNSKLEIFLKRNLKSTVYGDIRWHEPVVVRKGETLEYKQVVVTGDEVFMVDTPPKGITSLLSVSNLAAVLLVHDLPQFLEGGLRDRTTHILLKVRSDELRRRRRSSSSSRPSSRRHSLSSVTEEEEPSKSSAVDATKTGVDGDQKPTTSLYKKHLLTRRSSVELLAFAGGDSDEAKEKRESKHDRNRPPLLRSLARDDDRKFSTNSLSPDIRRSMEDISQECFDLRIPFPPGTSRLSDQRPLSPALYEIINRVDGNRHSHEGRASTPDISNLSRQILPRSYSALENYHEMPNFTLNSTFRSKSVLDKPTGVYSIQFTRRSQSVTDSSSEEQAENEEEIHLYSLSTSTRLYHLLHSLWMASLLTTEKSLLTFLSNTVTNQEEERYKKSFKDLCSLLRNSATPEEDFQLLQELRTGIRNHPSVRRLFWKECLELVRNRLKKYGPVSTQTTMSIEDDFEVRENELTLIVLSFEVLNSSLARSQGCPHKAKVFRSKTTVEGLLQEVFTPPELPAPQKLTCKRFLSDFKELSTMTWELLPERELIRLTQRVMDASVTVAFHIIEAIFEIGWSNSTSGKPKQNFDFESMTLHMLMQHISTEEWLSYAIPQLFFLIHVKPRNSDDGLSASEVVLIYQYLGVLLALFKQSAKSLAYCVNNFTEEIRYYINESTLKRKICPSNQLRSHTLRMAQSISRLFCNGYGKKKRMLR